MLSFFDDKWASSATISTYLEYTSNYSVSVRGERITSHSVQSLDIWRNIIRKWDSWSPKPSNQLHPHLRLRTIQRPGSTAHLRKDTYHRGALPRMIGFPNPMLPSGLLCNLCSHSRGRSVRSTLFWTSPRGIGLRP